MKWGEDGRLVGGKGWKEKVYNREEWKKLLRMARNCRILHMPMEWVNKWMNECMFMGKSLWTYILSTNIVSLWTNYDMAYCMTVLTKFMILTFSLPVWLVLICHHYMWWVFPVTHCCRPRWTEATSQSDLMFWCRP
jgi:hypothetical protein